MSGFGPSPTFCEHTNRDYCDVNDALFCPECDVWLESVCSDLECHYCSRRPALPSLETRPRAAPAPENAPRLELEPGETNDLEELFGWLKDYE